MKLLRSTKEWMANSTKHQSLTTGHLKLLLAIFIAWRIWITVFALLAVSFIPLRSPHLLGGTFRTYVENPAFWGWANFDGEHYLAIAQRGYRELEHSFFPGYPLLVRYFSGDSLFAVVRSGIIISSISFLLALFFLWRLLRLDTDPKTTKFSILALILFPTSFFLGALYTEAFFLLLAVSSFYAARKGNWFLAGAIGAVASATRVYGILLFPALLVEWVGQKKRKNNSLLFLGLIPIGLLAYMWFLFKTTGNPFAFYTELSVFGEQRGGEVVLLYQVFWRYIKMLLTVTKTDPIYFTILMEAVIGVGAFALIVWGYFKKIRPSYLVFAALGYILPTFTGSFSSLPRYVLVLFPLFLLLGMLLSQKGKVLRLVYFLVSATLLAVLTMLFVRGYWVA